MTDTITKERALDLLRQAVAQDGYGPEYVYDFNPEPAPGSPSCQYVRDGVPSCLVGHALALAGIPLKALTPLDKTNDNDARSLPKYLPEVSSEAAEVFEAAQSEQDVAQPWGEALRAAEAVAR